MFFHRSHRAVIVFLNSMCQNIYSTKQFDQWKLTNCNCQSWALEPIPPWLLFKTNKHWISSNVSVFRYAFIWFERPKFEVNAEQKRSYGFNKVSPCVCVCVCVLDWHVWTCRSVVVVATCSSILLVHLHQCSVRHNNPEKECALTGLMWLINIKQTETRMWTV